MPKPSWLSRNVGGFGYLVLLAKGVASYFSPPNEPPWYSGPVETDVLVIAAWTLHYVLLVLLFPLAIALGFLAN